MFLNTSTTSLYRNESWDVKTRKKSQPAQLHDGGVLAAVEVELAEEAVLDVVQHVSMHGVGWTLALQLEHNHAAVMT